MPANIAPTKTNLLKLRQDLKFASLGHELLDQKRSILIMELLNLVDQTVDYQNRVEALLLPAFRVFEEAVCSMGRREIFLTAPAVNIESSIRLKERKIMGVALPVVETSFTEHAPWYSPFGTNFRLDLAARDFKEALKLLGRLAELKISVMRLALEVKKTIRKVNALEKIAIPDLRLAVAHIQNRLEENERDMFILMKVIKQKLETKKREQA
ncbi:MAG: ATPase [Spirochaetes bacterium GWF1_41_5]|nr:MAG: ATPase [Spirochaetes bacterium GWF1_41_5]HBE04687.1 V-type ATP synthase subunit D [Spirochaetia bacterium]